MSVDSYYVCEPQFIISVANEEGKSKRICSRGEARTLNLEITIFVKVSRADQLCHAGWSSVIGSTFVFKIYDY